MPVLNDNKPWDGQDVIIENEELIDEEFLKSIL